MVNNHCNYDLDTGAKSSSQSPSDMLYPSCVKEEKAHNQDLVKCLYFVIRGMPVNCVYFILSEICNLEIHSQIDG